MMGCAVCSKPELRCQVGENEGAAVLCLMTHLPLDSVVWQARVVLLVGTSALHRAVITRESLKQGP